MKSNEIESLLAPDLIENETKNMDDDDLLKKFVCNIIRLAWLYILYMFLRID